jgi:hypothetical protein
MERNIFLRVKHNFSLNFFPVKQLHYSLNDQLWQYLFQEKRQPIKVGEKIKNKKEKLI